MMYEITPLELEAVKNALELADEELTGAEEGDYVLTVGAREALEEAMEIIGAIKKNGKKQDKTHIHT